MGFLKDVIFGTDDELTVEQKSTLTDEQKAMLAQLRKLTGSGGEFDPSKVDEFEGDLSAPMSNLEGLSLSALEDLARSRVSDTSEVNKQASASLIDMLQRGPEDISNFFEKGVQDPALRGFEEDVLPRIGRNFGGDFFGSDRQVADERAREDLVQGLSSDRSKFALASRESDLNRKIQALGMAPGVSGAPINELTSLLEAGAIPRDVENRRLEGEFAKFGEAKSREQQRLQLILQALGVQGVENIGAVTGGREGLLGAAVKAYAATAGS